MRGTGDILGHREPIARLWRALDRSALHHAYLFEGPAGVGKRTVALRLAMAANCTGEGSERPCGSCPPCARASSGNDPDVVLLQPDPERASGTITVEQVREVVRRTGYHRFGGKRRTIVVDPAEALPPPAANALLKTLEEPPEGTGFVLVATHASALLPTIVSRCQRVRFGPVPEAELAAWLQARGLDQGALAARLSLGCPGRAIELAQGGLAERAALRERLLQALSGDMGELFTFSQKLCTGSGRAAWVPRVEGLLEVVEELLRDVNIHGSGAALPLFHADAPEVVERWTEALWPAGAQACARAVDEARGHLARNVSGRILVDALLARLRRELGQARRG